MSISLMLLRSDGESVHGSVAFNFAALAIALLVSFLTGFLRPNWWRRAMFVAAALPVPILLGTSGNLAAGATVVGLLLPLAWLGRELAPLLHHEIDSVEAWVIGGAFGVGATGALGLLLGIAGSLRSQFIWPVPAIVALCLLATRREGVRRDIVGIARWLKRPAGRQPIVLLLTGIALGCFWLNLIGALAPEVESDAMRQRLATAVHFAQAGSLSTDYRDLNVAAAPALGEIVYATAVAAGSIQSAKLFHWLLGLCCAAAVFALGRRLGGKWAGGLAAFAFYHTVLVAYLSQTAYLDLFTTLFTTAATLCLTIGAGAKWRTAASAGVFIGLCTVIKVSSGYLAVGLALTAMILALQFGWREAIRHAIIVTVAAILVASPWLVRSYTITNALPGVQSAAVTLANTGPSTTLTYDGTQYGYGRSAFQLLIAPLTTLLLSRQFGGGHYASGAMIGGHLGFLLLGLTPLLLAARLRRRTIAIAAGAVVAGVFWFYTMQYVRYAVPIVALLCSVAGAAYIAAWRRAGSRRNRAVLNALLCILAMSGTFVTMQLPATAQRVAFGMESDQDYLDEWLGDNGAGSYRTLQLVNSDPSATRVFAFRDGARLYSNVPISSPWTTAADVAILGSDEQVLARLEAGGYSHILIDRTALWGDTWSWSKITAINEDFLRRNTELVGGGNNSYLYRILPPEQRGSISWVRGDELILDSGFEAPGFGGWLATGSPQVDSSGAHSHSGAGAVLLSTTDQLRTEIPVMPNTQYLLANATRSAGRFGGAQLFIEWRDTQGNAIDSTLENIPVSSDQYRTFSMLATAPSNAATAVVYAKVYNGTVWFDDFSLHVAALPKER